MSEPWMPTQNIPQPEPEKPKARIAVIATALVVACVAIVWVGWDATRSKTTSTNTLADASVQPTTEEAQSLAPPETSSIVESSSPSTTSTTSKPKPKPKPKIGTGVFMPTGLVLARNATPRNPGSARVLSPNRSPVANPADLRGPKIHFGCNDNPERLNSMTLQAGTVVQFERGCSWPNVRVSVRGNGTASQPILMHSVGSASKPAPIFGTKRAVDDVDAGIINLLGSNIHVSGIALADSESVGIRADGANGVLDNIVGSKIRIGAWIKGNGTKVWNSYFHNLQVRVVEGAHNDYGATGTVVEADNVTIEGLTCRVCWGSSPDYDQYGGDGSFVEVWQKGNNLKVSYGYVDSSARVYEAGSMGGGSQSNVSFSSIFARDIKDQPIYVNNEGKYQIGGGDPKVTNSNLNGRAY